MKNFILCFISLVFFSCVASAKEKFIKINISFEKGYNIIAVTYDLPKADTVFLYFPSTIPGIYSELPRKKPIDIGFKDSFSYTVSSGDGDTSGGILAANVFVNDDIAVINSNALIGCIKGQEKSPIRLTVIGLDGYTSVLGGYVFYFKNYDDLINNPLIFSKNLTCSTLEHNEISVSINVHSKYEDMTAQKLVPILSDVIRSSLNELDFIKMEGRYDLTFIFNDVVSDKIPYITALERPSQSVYLLFAEPELLNRVDSLDFAVKVQSTVAHEILHVFTPITFKDHSLEPFDYTSLSMSEHLWLYEGFTEYYSWKMLLKNEIVSEEMFFEEIARKIHAYSPFVKMRYRESLTEVSKHIYDDFKKLSVFYNRAAVVNMLLDIVIIESTQGEKDLFDVLKEVYGNNHPTIDTSELFNQIIAKTNDIVRDFINDYIIGVEYPDLPLYFSKAGLAYSIAHKDFGYYFPMETFEHMDNITEINHESLSPRSLSKIYKKYFSSPQKAQITYMYNGVSRTSYIETVKASVPRVPFYPHISKSQHITDKQAFVMNKLLFE